MHGSVYSSSPFSQVNYCGAYRITSVKAPIALLDSKGLLLHTTGQPDLALERRDLSGWDVFQSVQAARLRSARGRHLRTRTKSALEPSPEYLKWDGASA